MKNEKTEKIVVLVLFLLFLPILLLGLLIYTLVYTPYDYARYKRSVYCRDQKRRYRWLFAKSNCFKIYNSVKKHGLPIEYVEESESNFGQGYFFYRDVLIIYDDVPVFDEKESCWTVSREGEEDNEYINALDVIKSEIEDFNSLFNTVNLTRGVILCRASEIEDDLSHLEECEFIVTYENDPADALRGLIGRIDGLVC